MTENTSERYGAERSTARQLARATSLTESTRAYFAALANGDPEPDDNFGPFWEALRWVATRSGRSDLRENLFDDVTRLRTVVAEHGTVPAPPVTLTVPRNVAGLLDALLSNAAEDSDDVSLLPHFNLTPADVDAVRADIARTAGWKA